MGPEQSLQYVVAINAALALFVISLAFYCGILVQRVRQLENWREEVREELKNWRIEVREEMRKWQEEVQANFKSLRDLIQGL